MTTVVPLQANSLSIGATSGQEVHCLEQIDKVFDQFWLTRAMNQEHSN